MILVLFLAFPVAFVAKAEGSQESWMPDFSQLLKYQPTYKYNITNSKCEKLEVQWCPSLSYTTIALPNLLHEKDQRKINQSLNGFSELLFSQCGKDDLLAFICSLYAPECREKLPFPLPPCRPLCKRVRRKCRPTMEKYHKGWPRELRCGQFPAPHHEVLCVDYKRGRYKLRGKASIEDYKKIAEKMG